MLKVTPFRLPILALAILTLLAALWAGWLRLGFAWPAFQPALPGLHGTLMISGFLGTLVALERAVALGHPWMYAGPLLTGLGGIVLIANLPRPIGALLIFTGSLVLFSVLVIIIRSHSAAYTIVMGLGVFCWTAGNFLWLLGWSIPRLVLFWAAFLVLTIAGERLELGRLIRLSSRAAIGFNILAGVLIFSLFACLFSLAIGTRIFGAASIGLSIWLLRFDLARRTVHQKGLPRFAAVCLLSGYIWLGAGGLVALFTGAMAGGMRYDAFLHTIFVGFVISMIFGHAPIIFPAVLQLPISYTPLFYAHLFVLHASLVTRITGDLLQMPLIRLWGGLFNGIAVLLFLILTVGTILKSRLNLANGAAQ